MRFLLSRQQLPGLGFAAVALVGIALLGSTFGNVVLQLSTQSTTSYTADAERSIATPLRQPVGPDTGTVQSLNLFGKTMVEPEDIDVKALPDTPLSLQLVGIIGHSNATTARSLIAEAGKPAQPYFQGDALPGGAELVRIDRHFVIVRRGEKLEKLQFAGGPSTAKAAPTRRRSITEAVTETPTQPMAVENIDPNDPDAVYDGLRERLAAIRRAQQAP